MNLIQFNPDWKPSPVEAQPRARAVPPTEDKSIPVVIAEDDPVSRKLVTAVVELGGFRTTVTKDGEEAMTALRAQQSPCVAVIDWMMPGIDGAEICRRMREIGKDVYIIMLTARGAKEDMADGLEGGADDYLVKPFDRRELMARISGGVRVLKAQMALSDRVRELELEQSDLTDKPIKFQMPI